MTVLYEYPVPGRTVSNVWVGRGLSCLLSLPCHYPVMHALYLSYTHSLLSSPNSELDFSGVFTMSYHSFPLSLLYIFCINMHFCIDYLCNMYVCMYTVHPPTKTQSIASSYQLLLLLLIDMEIILLPLHLSFKSS